MKVKLYPNYLNKQKGAYIARTANQKTLSIEDVCTALKTRGGYDGKYEDLVECVYKYYEEAAYQFCNGYGVNNGWYCVGLKLCGFFESVNEAFNKDRHLLCFNFVERALLRKLKERIKIEILGIADASGYIDAYIDTEDGFTNSQFIPGNMFVIHGYKIKIAGDNPEVGVYFVPLDAPSKAVKVARISENTPSKITGIAPNTYHMNNKVEIRTQFSGNNSDLLKTVRIIESRFVLESV